VLFAALATTIGCGDRHGGTPERSDAVVIIDIDTLRADGLSCYGNPRATSPAIDRFAAESVRFEWAFAQAPNTPPSQASILSGRYPSRHGRIGDFDVVAPEVETLAEVVRAAGFQTGAFVDGGFMAAGFGLEQGFDVYDDARGAGIREVAKRGLAWLDTVESQRVLLFLHAYDVHSPYAPPEPIRSEFRALVDEPSEGFEPTAERLELLRKARHFDPTATLPERDRAYTRALYDGEVRSVDQAVAEILSALARTRRPRKTIVAIVSDHGEEFFEHGSVLHEKLYTTVLRVPLIIRAPGWSPGSVVPEVVQTVDLMPTLLELLQVPAPSGLDGRSLVETTAGRRGGGFAYSESPFFGQERSLAAGSWRLFLRLDRERTELFRFRDDPAEQRDHAQAQPEVTERFRTMAKQIESRLALEREGRTPEKAGVDAETVRLLRSLGYLQ